MISQRKSMSVNNDVRLLFPREVIKVKHQCVPEIYLCIHPFELIHEASFQAQEVYAAMSGFDSTDKGVCPHVYHLVWVGTSDDNWISNTGQQYQLNGKLVLGCQITWLLFLFFGEAESAAKSIHWVLELVRSWNLIRWFQAAFCTAAAGARWSEIWERSWYFSDGPFPGFTLEVNGPIFSLMWNPGFQTPPGDLSATIGISELQLTGSKALLIFPKNSNFNNHKLHAFS